MKTENIRDRREAEETVRDLEREGFYAYIEEYWDFDGPFYDVAHFIPRHRR